MPLLHTSVYYFHNCCHGNLFYAGVLASYNLYLSCFGYVRSQASNELSAKRHNIYNM